MWVRSLCWKDPLEGDLETYSIILAWRIPWTEEPGGLQLQRVGHTGQLSMHTHKYLNKHEKDVERNTPNRYTDFLHHVEIIMQGVIYK